MAEEDVVDYDDDVKDDAVAKSTGGNSDKNG